MKVGVITINSQNMGNRLQNYAVQEVLKKMGAEVETLNNQYCGREVTTFKHTLKICVQGRTMPSLFRKRREGFYRFTDKYIKMNNNILSYGRVPEGIENEFDYFICGSDQVWNPNFDFISDNEFLTFAKPEQKIAYSVSLGVSDMDDIQIENLTKKIRDFKAISVREEAGAKLIHKAGREAEVLLDPTMMLTRDEWLEIAQKPSFLTEQKYILTYFLGEKLAETDIKLQELAKKKNWKIINLWDIKYKKYFLTTPEEFVYLIANSELVCTDSFHGSVFSILMGVPFIVQMRRDKEKSMNSRLETLLGKLKLKEHFMMDEMSEDKMLERNYVEAYEIIETERKKTEKFLHNALC